MKQIGTALVMGLVAVLALVILLGWTAPGQDELRAEQAQIKQQHARELAPYWLVVKKIGVGSLGVIFASAAAVAASGGVTALAGIPAYVRKLRIWSWLLRPGRKGVMYPAVAAPDGNGHITVIPPVNEPGAQKVAALTTGLDSDVKLIGSAARAALRNDPNETIMPETEPAAPPLPSKLLIYSAPLADQLHLPVGHDGYGPVQLPLRDLGSGIVGGLPKMGKSECIASMMAGLLRQDATGTRIQLAVSDLKGGLDFGRMPHDLAGLAWPVAKSPEEAVTLVNNVWAEVERRQKLLERAGAARVEVYNQRSGVEPLPYLFLVIDELAMITMAAEERGMDKATRQQSAEFNGRAVRIVSVGRALGISMIGATQKPSGAVIPTQLRDLCGFRIAFRCMTQDASKAVLGVPGAEELPEERGLALFLGDQAQPRRIRTYLAVIDGGKFDGFVARLPRRERLQLPADAEADGLGPDDLPDSDGVETTFSSNSSSSSANGFWEGHIPPSVNAATATTATERPSWEGYTRAEQLDDARRAYIIATWHRLYRERGRQPSRRAVETAAIGYPGGAAYYLVGPVLAEYFRKNPGVLQNGRR